MTTPLGKGRSFASARVTSLVLALAVLAPQSVAAPAQGATPLTVSQAIGQQTGSAQTVRG